MASLKGVSHATANVEFSLTGEVAADLSRLIRGRFRSKRTSASGLDVTEVAFDVNDLPGGPNASGGTSSCRDYEFSSVGPQVGQRASNVQYLRVESRADGSVRYRIAYVRTAWAPHEIVAPSVCVSFACTNP